MKYVVKNENGQQVLTPVEDRGALAPLPNQSFTPIPKLKEGDIVELVAHGITQGTIAMQHVADVARLGQPASYREVIEIEVIE